jgi:hypothetical protein
VVMKPSAQALALVVLSVATPALAGRLEDVRDRFNQVQSDYAETKSYVDSGNIDSAKSATAKLNEDTNKVCPFTQDIKDRIAELPSLQSSWKEVSYWCLELAIRSSELKNKLGSTNPSDQMSKVTEAFMKLGDSLKAGYDKFGEFGKNWTVICSDMCR